MGSSRRDIRRTFGLVLAASLSLYTLTAGGSLTSTDAVVTFELAKSIVERHSIALDRNVIGSEANRGLDGRYYSQFGLGQSLYDIPFYVAGRAALRLAGRPIGKPDTVPKAAVALGSAVAGAMAVALLWWLAWQLTGHARASLVSAASAAIASPLWPYSKFGFSTALTAAILAGTAGMVWRAGVTGRWSTAGWAGLLLGFGWITRHELAIMILPFALVLWLSPVSRGKQAAGLVAVFVSVSAMGGVAWMIYNAARFGRPLFTGYTPVFGIEGYAAFLGSPSGSVLLFCPIVVVWIAGVLVIAKEDRPAAILLGSPFLVSYLFYGALQDWPGGRSYGPRYLVPALVVLSPGLAVLIVRGLLRVRTALLITAVLAVLQLPGVLVDYSKVSVEWAQSAPRDDLAARTWIARASPLFLNTAAAIRAVPENAAYLSGWRPAPAVPAVSLAGDRTFAQQLSFSVDFWWAYLAYLRVVPRTVALCVASVLLVLAAASSWLAWRSVSGRA